MQETSEEKDAAQEERKGHKGGLNSCSPSTKNVSTFHILDLVCSVLSRGRKCKSFKEVLREVRHTAGTSTTDESLASRTYGDMIS